MLFDKKYLKKNGGLILEFDEEGNEDTVFDEWKNPALRESIAISSIVKIRKIHSGTYFQKGKLNELGYFLKENPDINVVYINSTLTGLQ